MFKNASKPFLYFLLFLKYSFLVLLLYVAIPIGLFSWLVEIGSVLVVFFFLFYYPLLIIVSAIYVFVGYRELKRKGIVLPINYATIIWFYMPFFGLISYSITKDIAKIESKKLQNNQEVKI